MTIVFTLFLRSRAAPCRMVAVASSLVGSLAASWAGSRAVLVKPVKSVAKLTKLARRRIEMLAKPAKPVARRIEQLHQMAVAAAVNSSGGRQVDRLKPRLSGGDADDRL